MPLIIMPLIIFLKIAVLLAVLLSGINVLAVTPTLRQDMRYADPKSCAECHQKACDDWAMSDHSRSMEHANKDTVLGDFNDVRFVHIGFDDLLHFDDATLKSHIDDIFHSPQPSWEMRHYLAGTPHLTETPHLAGTPVSGAGVPAKLLLGNYNRPGNKFKPTLIPRFEDFALTCFDAQPGVIEKLRSVMNEAQRKEFDDETEYRTSLLVNRPGDIAAAQSRIVTSLCSAGGAARLYHGEHKEKSGNLWRGQV